MQQFDSRKAHNHLVAVYISLGTARTLCEVLPETDIVCDLRGLLKRSDEVIGMLLKGDDYGASNLDLLVNDSVSLSSQVIDIFSEEQKSDIKKSLQFIRQQLQDRGFTCL